MKKALWIMALLTLPVVSKAALVGFNAENGASDTTTVSASLGDYFTPPQSDPNALGGQYITTSSGGSGTSPGTDAHIASYEVTFTEAGTYDLYVREYCGPNPGGDDSMFYGNGFGLKDASIETDWITCNGGWGFAGGSIPMGQYLHEHRRKRRSARDLQRAQRGNLHD